MLAGTSVCGNRGTPFKLMESPQYRWRAVNRPPLIALVRGGARFEKGQLPKGPDEQEAISKACDTPIRGS